MSKNIHPATALLLLAAVLATGLFFVHRYRYRFVRNRSDLVRRLPSEDATTFFADVNLLRQAGLLNMLASSQAESEPDYRQFVHETGFDYSRNLDALAGSYRSGRLALFLQGRFEWRRLRSYAASHGGSCVEQRCELPGSQAGRWISFGELQPDVLALSIGSDRNGVVKLLTRIPPQPPPDTPNDPIWLQPAHSLFQNPAALPVPVRIFALALQSASTVVISGTQSERADNAFTLRLEAHFENSAAADTSRAQFEMDTNLLKAELAREHATPNSADLSGLVTSGAFQTVGNDLVAQWPVKRKLLQSLR